MVAVPFRAAARLAILTFTLAAPAAAQAQIVTYDFTTSVAPTVNPNNGSLSASAFGSNPAGSVSGGTYSFSLPVLTLGTAGFTVTAAPGYQVAITSVSYSLGASAVFAGVLLTNSVSTPSGTNSQTTLLTLGNQAVTFDHTDYVLQPNQTATYAFSVPAAASVGSLTFDNVMVYGTVSPVPEPTSMLLLGAGALGAARWWRRSGPKAVAVG